MDFVSGVLKLAGKSGIRKMPLNAKILKLAACFIDYESEHLPPDSRIAEYSYVLSKLMGLPKGRALDVGCIARHNYASPMLAFAGWDVWGIDIRSQWEFHHTNFHFVKDDIRDNKFAAGWFDVVISLSTLEHIGLAGYYGNVVEDEDGDIQAMEATARIIKPGGRLLLTVPFCYTFIRRPGVRIYNLERLTKVLNGFEINDKVVYHKLKDGNWEETDVSLDHEGVICLEAIRK